MQAKRIHNFLLLVGTNIITKGAWALCLIIMLRSLGAEEFGLLVTLWAIGTIAAVFSDLGVSQVLLRDGARQKDRIKALARTTLFVNSIIAILLTCILTILVWLFFEIPEISTVKKILIIFSGVSTPIIDRFQNIFTVFSQLNERFNTYTKIRSLYFTILLLSFWVVSYIQPSLTNFSITYFFITIIATIVMGTTIWDQLPVESDLISTDSFSTLIKYGFPFLWITALTFAYGRIEVVILSLHGETGVSGAYHIIYQIVLLVYSLSGMFFTVIYPRLYQHKKHPDLLNEDYKDTISWLTLLVAATSPLIFLYANQILALLGGKELSNYICIIHELTLLILLLPASVALNFLLPMDMLKHRIISDAIGIGITIFGILILLESNNIEHIALAAVIGYLASVLTAMYSLNNKTRVTISTTFSEMLFISIRALIPFALIYFLSMPWWLGVPVYLLIFYFILMKTQHHSTQKLSKITYKLI